MENRSNIAAPGGITRRSFVKGGAAAAAIGATGALVGCAPQGLSLIHISEPTRP